MDNHNLTPDQIKYLELVILEQKKFAEIKSILALQKGQASILWRELKEPREYLSALRQRWFQKTANFDKEKFQEFKKWFESTSKQCHYCNLTQPEMEKLWALEPNLTKRGRGRVFEIDRKEPNLAYEVDISKNLVLACYWCNNAKTDTFTYDEFIEVGKSIKTIWENRLKLK